MLLSMMRVLIEKGLSVNANDHTRIPMPLRSATIFLFSAISTCLALPLMVAGQGHSITNNSLAGGDPRSIQQSGQSTPQPLQQSSPVVNQAAYHDVSPPLLLIPPLPRQLGFRIHGIGPIAVP